MVLRMAWRNTWRNPRRTGVVLAAVAVGIAGTLLSVAFNYGVIVGMVDAAIATDLGHLQVHAAGYEDDPQIDRVLPEGAREVARALESLPEVEAFARRVRAEGLVSSPRASAGVRIVGIEPDREREVTTIAASIVAGEYLDGRARRVVIGAALADRLEVDVGDKLVLSAQDRAGDLAGEALRVEGVYRTASRPLDRSTVFLRIEDAQRMLALEDAVSEVVARTHARQQIETVRSRLAAELGALEVRSWDQLQPVLLFLVQMFDQSAVLIYAAIFIAMAFGIANVLLMTVFERTREIGVMRAIGFGRGRLVATLVAEAVIVTGLGVALGFAGALLAVWSLREGIDLAAFADGLNAWGIDSRIRPVVRTADFTWPTLVAFVTAVVASAWPAWRAVRLVPAEAVRHT